jgi:hypothetical protein
LKKNGEPDMRTTAGRRLAAEKAAAKDMEAKSTAKAEKSKPSGGAGDS